MKPESSVGRFKDMSAKQLTGNINQLAAISFRERLEAEAHGKSFAVKGSHKPCKTARDVDFFFAKTPDNEQPHRRSRPGKVMKQSERIFIGGMKVVEE